MYIVTLYGSDQDSEQINSDLSGNIIVNSLRLWVKYVGAFRNVKSKRYIYIYEVICNEYNRYCYLAWGVWLAATGGCHSLPKLWAMVPGPWHANGIAIELGEWVALVLWPTLRCMLIETGGLGETPAGA